MLIPSFKAICPMVMEIFQGFYYIGGSIYDLNEIGPVVSEEKPFENVDR